MKKNNRQQKEKSEIGRIGFAVFLFLFLAIAMNLPMVLNISNAIWGGGDSLVYVWNFWWVKKAVLELRANAYFTDYVFYPAGISLAFHGLTPFNSLLSVPLQFFFNGVTIYNLLVLAGFFFSAIGTYLLAFHITKNNRASVIAGTIFAFSTIRFAHITHLDVLTTQWIPFFVLFLLKSSEEEGKKNPAIAGFFLFLTAISNWYHTVFLAVSTFFFLAYYRKALFSGKKLKENITKLATGILVFTALFFPFGLPIAENYLSEGKAAESSIASSILQSADFLGFFVPAPFHPVFGKATEGFFSGIMTYDGALLSSPAESVTYIGYAALFLGIVAVAKAGKESRFWLLCSLFFFVMSLGPVLHFNGVVKIPIDFGLEKIATAIEPGIDERALSFIKGGIGIPMPYLLWHYLPVLNIARAASRFAIMGLFFLSIAAAIGFSRTENKNNAKWLFFVVIGIVLFEYLPFAMPLSGTQANNFYETISAEKEDFAIVELPLCNSFEECSSPAIKRTQFFQTIHGKRVLAGMFSRIPEKSFSFINSSEELQLLSEPEKITEKSALKKEFFEKNRLKLVIIHKEYFSSEDHERLSALLGKSFEKFFEDNEITVFKTY